MRQKRRLAVLVGAWGISLGTLPPLSAQSPSPAATLREIAVTFDDLPAVSVVNGDPASLSALTDRLLAHFAAHSVPVVGFVNEGKLTVSGESLDGQAARITLLRKWLAAGFELGNHTFSHRSLNDLPLEEFQADVVRGEPAISALLSAHGGRLRYFRHPFLQVGLSIQKRQAFEEWLVSRGYTIAPVTIDNDEYIFAAVYATALKGGDRAMASKVGEAYIAYMEAVFGFNEHLSESLFGRAIRHVLLLHANELNADHAGRLFARLAQRGYRFVTLARAIEDPAFQTADTYVGRWGISWMHHWELTMGRARTGSPDPPAWVTQAYEKGRR